VHLTSSLIEIISRYIKVITTTKHMPKKENTFLLLSLEDDKAKRLSNVLGSDTCRKLLDYLAKKEATETELSKELQIPISTVHYNLRQLLEAGLVRAEEFHYSKKGKEVNHYRIANKYVIIAPKTTESLANKLKRVLPVAAMLAATGVAIQFFSSMKQTTVAYQAQQVAKEVSVEALAAEAEAPKAVQVAQPSIALWFTIGALFALVIYLLYDVIKERLK
jgi:predicted transcriptional regulator